MKQILFSTLTVITLLFTTGCSPMISKYRVSIDAITVPNLTTIPKSYSIQALDKKTDTHDLKFQSHTQTLNTLLQKEGYTLANSGLIGEQIIHFDYGIEKVSEETQTYREPDVTFGFSVGYPYSYYGHRYHPYWSDFGYGSYTTYRKRYAYYNRYITLLGKEATGRELWRVDVSSIGESTNLKKIIPLLIESAIPYIGKNPKEPIHIIIKEKRAKEE